MNAKERTQEERRRINVRTGQRYRHFKGGEYVIVETAVHESSGEILVIYHALKDDTIWARPLEEWNAEVDAGPGEKQRRFTLISQ